MAILREQSIRLLRTKWKEAQSLAEEVYAILNSDTPFTIDGPVTINNQTGGPAVTINQTNDNSQVFNVTRTDPGTPQLPGLPPLPPATPGRRHVLIINEDGTMEYDEYDPGGQPDPQPRSQGGGGGFPGTVVSGSGSSYRVSILTEQGTQVVDATQIQIAADAAVPAGTGVIVAKVGSSYYMQAPVWGADLE